METTPKMAQENLTYHKSETNQQKDIQQDHGVQKFQIRYQAKMMEKNLFILIKPL